ncbi:MAG: b(o/a)3-type cytochrome-c oxidase subunit 1 [Candidatus Kapaibacterium sp.]
MNLKEVAMELDPKLKRLTLIQLAVPVGLLVVGISGGLLQALMRSGIIQADSALGLEYYQGLTLHGIINAIVFTTFFAVAFGNALVSYALKAKLNVKVAWISNILMLLGTLMVAAMVFAGEGSVLYTFYPPLKANPIFYAGLALFVVGSWVAFWNWIPMYLRWRRENPGEKTPMAVVGIFTTFIVWQICTIPVAYEVLVLLLPWSLGWTDTINIELTRTLFWFFGHPLVYFWLLPAYVMYYTMLPKLAGGKLYSDLAGRVVFMLFVIFSIPVGAHHQFTEPGIGSDWKLLHAFLTFGVAIPSLITAFTIAASLEYAGRKRGGKGLFGWFRTLPYLDGDRYLFPYLFVGLVIFIVGGSTGIINASYNMNLVVHNTAWIPGHFHLTVAGPVFLAFIGMSLYMVEKMTGKEVKFKKLAATVPYMWIVGLFTFSFGMMRGGLHGEPRRTNMGMTYLNPDSPLYRPEWEFYVTLTVIGGVILFLAMLVYFGIFFGTLMGKKTREEELVFPLSTPYHNEKAGAFANFKPWVIGAIVLIVLSYTPVFIDVMRSTSFGAPAYNPHLPVPENQMAAPPKEGANAGQPEKSGETSGEKATGSDAGVEGK